MDDLIKRVDRIMRVRVMDMAGIPEIALEELHGLLSEVPKPRVLEAMEALLPAYVADCDRLMAFKSGSGTHSEFQMEASLKRLYLERSIEYLQAGQDA